MKFYKLAVAAVAVLVSSSASAAFMTYDDKMAFQAAAGTTVTEDFNSVAVGTNFIGTPLDLGGFTLQRTIGEFGIFDFGEIEGGSGAFNVDGTNFASVQTATYIGNLVLNFDEPIFAFGLDLRGFNDLILRTSIWLDDDEYPGLTTVASNDSLSFLGFTSDTSFTSITFLANDIAGGDSGDGFGIDNIEYSTVSAVPVPAAAWLFGSAILAMFGFSRRKARV